MKLKRNYFNLQESYLFSTIAHKVEDYQKKNPEQKIIRMGIGDVTRPLCPKVVEAMQQAALEMGQESTFRGYGPEQGYAFLREDIRGYYANRGVALQEDEIFISDGAKSDLGNILDLFSADNSVLIPNPVYPVYVDTNVMAGRRISYLFANRENQFLPMPDLSQPADIIYLCSPNNPTGAVYNKEQLAEWVRYARKQHALILFDAAYEAFVQDPLPHSIFEIEGAKQCAIEFCSLSKTAGFTGTRCGYTVVPNDLVFENAGLNKLWLRRQTTKFNGVPYVVQKAASAVFTEEGQQQVRQNIAYYQQNAAVISSTLQELGIWFIGGRNSPYIWMQCPKGLGSWQFFDILLEKCGVVGTPGSGFGSAGEGYFRLTAFGSHDDTKEAMTRFSHIIVNL